VLILALDTTTRAGSAALLDDNLVRAVAAGDASRTHGERLPAELAHVLELGGARLEAVDLLAVASGPGAFTGLRIGLAAMQALAMTLDRPVIGISALDALAAAAFESLGVRRARIGAWMDAARGEVFAALYEAEGNTGGCPWLTPLRLPEVATAETICARWGGDLAPDAVLVGDGAERYGGAAQRGLRVLSHPLLAPAIGRLAGRAVADGRPHIPHHLQPLYVRRPDVEHG